MPTKTAKRYHCRHIFIDGRQCGSPSLRNEQFCYYHHNTRRGAAARALFRNALASGYALPVPEDEKAIQQSLHLIIQKLVTSELDPKRAGLVLYGLQIAAQTIDRGPRNTEEEPPISDMTHDTELGDLAPQQEYDE